MNIEIAIDLFEDTSQVRLPANLLRSIGARGVLVPVLAAREGEHFRILDGRRRVACARQLKLAQVPAVVLGACEAEVTIMAHATRSENPLAELQAIRALQAQGLGEREIARAGFASLGRIRRLARLNRLAPEIAERVEAGQIPASLAFQIAKLPPTAQRELAKEEHVRAPQVRMAQATRRQEALPAGLGVMVPASLEETLAELSHQTLERLLAEIPPEARFSHWRERISRVAQGCAQALQIPERAALEA